MSAYVCLALGESWRAGYKINYTVLNKCKKYLKKIFYRTSPDTKALISYSLARAYDRPYRQLTIANRARSRLSPYGLALLSLAYGQTRYYSMARYLNRRLISLAKSDSHGGHYFLGGRRHSYYSSSVENFSTSTGLNQTTTSMRASE